MKKLVCFCAFTLWLCPVSGFASGGDALLIPASPRAIALGGASGALADDVYALLYNPAGLAGISQTEISLAHRIGTIDASEYAAFARPMQIGGVLGGSILYSYLPDIDNSDATDPAVTVNDMLLTLAYATPIPLGSKDGKNLSVGMDFKWLRSVLGGYSAATVAVDLGARWQPAELNDLQVGLTLQNLGLAIQYVDVQDALPFNLKLGAAYRLLADSVNTVNLAADMNYPLVDKGLNAGLGAEYWYNKLMAVRVGYHFQKDSLDAGIVGGIGVRYTVAKLALQLDYAFKPVYYSTQVLEPEHYLALRALF